ncbi:MAG: DUF5752 family protein [archaeon]
MTDSFWLNRADFQPVAKIGSLSEMIEALRRAPRQVVSHHITPQKNDFANWVKNSLHNPDLASRLSSIKCDDPRALEKIIEALSSNSQHGKRK